jgi:hypothetical protein
MARSSNERVAALLTLLAGATCWAAVLGVAPHYGDFVFDLGSITYLAPGYATFVMYHLFLGGLGALLTGIGVARLLRAPHLEKLASLVGGPDRTFLVAATSFAFLVPVAVRLWVLQDAPLTDDESAYRFMAQVLAGGSVTAASPEHKLFYDRLFMINDGRLFAQYFLGWPALMAPAVPLGMTGYVNAVMSALTVPAAHYVGTRLAGPRWGRITVGLYLVAPMLVVGAATELSHTSCLCMIAWSHAALEKTRERPGWRAAHFGFGLFFAAAFFIRPLSALAIGLPLLWVWLRASTARRDKAGMISFAVPAAVLAVLFLWVNVEQTGSALKPAYQYLIEYAKQNGFRFSDWHAGTDVTVRNMSFGGPLEALGLMGAGLVRLNTALLGWPVSVAFVPITLGIRRARLLWACIGCFLLFHFPLSDLGVDTFGPVHYTELAWPVLLLTTLGIKVGWLWLRRLRPRQTWLVRLPGTFAMASVAAALLLYVPARIATLSVIADDVNAPFKAVRVGKLGPAVIFSPRPFTPRCDRHGPTPRHFVFWRPNNDPQLQNETLWVNHLSLRADRELMKQFPNRRGWILRYHECQPRLERLDGLSEGEVENGWIGNRMTPGGVVPEMYTDESAAP